MVYTFGNGHLKAVPGEGDILGSKGANLAEMAALGLPVPPGATIISPAAPGMPSISGIFPNPCPGRSIRPWLKSSACQVGPSAVRRSLCFWQCDPLPVPIPGMIEAILNLGLNDETVEALAEETGDRRFAYDCYRRFISSFGDAVMGLDRGYSRI